MLKKIGFCRDVYKIYVGDDIENFTVCLTRLKNKNSKIKDECVEKIKKMDPHFEKKSVFMNN